MQIVNLNLTKKQSFARGFLKGLGAPVVLFGSFEAPALPKVMQIKLESRSDQLAIAGDWQRVAGDFRTAINKYGEIPKK